MIEQTNERNKVYSINNGNGEVINKKLVSVCLSTEICDGTKAAGVCDIVNLKIALNQNGIQLFDGSSNHPIILQKLCVQTRRQVHSTPDVLNVQGRNKSVAFIQ